MAMKKQVLFIQGGGERGYQTDAKLVRSLQAELGSGYAISYPAMKTDETAPDFGWLAQIGREISKLQDNAILTAHSLGASLLLKYLSENNVPVKIAGVFLIAAPFWSGKEDWKQGLKLHADFAERLPENTPIYFYHARDDEEVPFDQLASYRKKVPLATFREIESGGHMIDNSIGIIADDIRELQVNYLLAP